jgi:FkbM family methyltransferase
MEYLEEARKAKLRYSHINKMAKDMIVDLRSKFWRLFWKQVQSLRRLIWRGSHNVALERLRDPIEVYNLVRASLPKGSLALDVGANVGQYVGLLVPRFNRVLAFEPSREAFVKLINQVKDYPNLEVYNVAILDTTAIINLHKYEGGWRDFDLSILDEPQAFDCWGRKIGKVPVLAIRLDDLRLSTVDFIKIDVEGSETAVVKGAMETITKNRPTLFIEIHEKSQGEQIIGLLKEMYDFKVIRHPAYAPNTFLWAKHYFLLAIPQER